MRILILILCVFEHFYSTVEARPAYFIAAPSVFRLQTPETVSVSVINIRDVRIKLYLQDYPDRQKRLYETTITVSEGEVQNATFVLNSSDIPDRYNGSEQYVVLMAECNSTGMTFSKETVILLSRISGYIFIQTDKPVYTPNQEVKVRVIALNEMKLPSSLPIRIDIKNPQGIIVQRKNATYQGNFIIDVFKLPSRPFYGNNWTIEARFLNGIETEKHITFEVKEYVLPKFSVIIQTEPKVILPTTDYIRINVSASYFHGEPVNGTCVLTYGIIADGQQRLSDVDLKREISGSTQFALESLTINEKFPHFWFPDGARLYLEVTVLDKGTGRRQTSTDKSTVFSNHLYRISTAKSQKYFKPGLMYELKIETFLADGKRRPYCELILSCEKNTRRRRRSIRFTRSLKTDENGLLAENIRLHSLATSLICNIKTNNDRNNDENSVETEVTHEVYAMRSTGRNKFIKVKAKFNDGMLSTEVRKSSGIQASYFVHLLISNGRIVSSLINDGSISDNHKISGNLAPTIRIVSYAIERHGRRYMTVADSSVLELAAKCHQHQETKTYIQIKSNQAFNSLKNALDIVVENTTLSPNSSLLLNITGPPLSKVGFVAVDKAVYEISDRRRIDNSMMFSEFIGHDLGCSTGGGINVNKVFEDSGLTVITNAEVLTRQRRSAKCQTTGRKKREIDARQQTNPCCLAGNKFGQTHLVNTQSCYFEGGQVFNLTNSSICAKAFYKCCMKHSRHSLAMESGPLGTTRGSSNFFDWDRMVIDTQDEEFTFRDINTLIENVEIRSFFPEAWLFEEDSLNINGELMKTVLVPDSITTYVFEAVSLSSLYGMCIAEPVEVISTKDFFIDLDLPYSVVRMEQTEIRATIYNYKSYKLPCEVTFMKTDVVCSTAEDTIQIDVGPYNVQHVKFPIVPMKAGEFRIDVMVTSVDNIGDRIRKTLLVVNEGREEKKTVSFWLDPKGRRQHYHDRSDENIEVTHPSHRDNTQITTVDMVLPKKAIPGTGNCKVSAISNIMDSAVQTILGGVDTLLDNVPTGCGEQTMIIMAPIVYAMRYLQGTSGVTPEAEKRGKFFMKIGYQRELAFRKMDGSFSVWQHRPSSTWLTAFVLKVFGQAKVYIDIDEHVICSGMTWLFTNQNSNGSFSEPSPVYHKEIMGGINGETSLTAFVLISLLECDCQTEGISNKINRAVRFLERQYLHTHHPYSLSIVAYALGLANYKWTWRVNKKLKKFSKFEGFPGTRHKGYRYWPIETSDRRNQTGVPYWYKKNPSAVSIETTSYALLTQLGLNKIAYSRNIVEWLIEQQQSSGAFISTQDTIVGLQALSMYNIRKYAGDVDMRCNVSTEDNSTFKNIHLMGGESMVEKSVHDLPATGKLNVAAKGRGVARMEVEVRYHVNDTELTGCKFDINIEINDIDIDILQEKQTQRENQCDVCGECEIIDYDDYDILLDKYNIPDPDPRIGFSNDNVYHPSMIGGPRPPVQEQFDDEASVDLRPLITNLGGSSSTGNDRRRHGRRLARSTRIHRRGAVRQQKCIEICVSYLGNQILDMPVIDVGLPTGYFVEEEDLKKVGEADFIDSYEVSKRSITFYMEKIPQEEICFKLRMLMEFKVENLQSAKVEVYDYSNRDERCVKFYSLKYDVAELDVFCNKEICHCVEGDCAKNMDNKLKGHLVTGKHLLNMTCHQYDYVLRMEVTGVRIVGNHIVVATVIHSVVHKVADRGELAADSEVDFWMNLRCSEELLQQGHYYIIYGNEAYKYVDEWGTNGYRYYLQGDSVVIKDYTRSIYNPDRDPALRYWKIFLEHMEDYIKNYGC